MSIDNIDKDHLKMLMISLNKDNNNLELIKSSYANYNKLKLLASQIEYLKNEAINIIKDAEIQNELHCIEKNFKLVSGTIYYLYKKSNNKKYMSIISPEEWSNNNDMYLGKYLFDYDKQFIELN